MGDVKKYQLWDVLKPLEHNIDFKVLEQKILVYIEVCKQGIVNKEVTDALNKNDFSISATFKGINSQHKLVIKGMSVMGIDILESGFTSILVSDVLVDDISFIKDKNEVLGMVI